MLAALGRIVLDCEKVGALSQIRLDGAIGNVIALVMMRVVLVQVAILPVIAVIVQVADVGAVRPLVEIVTRAVGETRIGG